LTAPNLAENKGLLQNGFACGKLESGTLIKITKKADFLAYFGL
jgi:hypothetical protein